MSHPSPSPTNGLYGPTRHTFPLPSFPLTCNPSQCWLPSERKWLKTTRRLLIYKTPNLSLIFQPYLYHLTKDICSPLALQWPHLAEATTCAYALKWWSETTWDQCTTSWTTRLRWNEKHPTACQCDCWSLHLPQTKRNGDESIEQKYVELPNLDYAGSVNNTRGLWSWTQSHSLQDQLKWVGYYECREE